MRLIHDYRYSMHTTYHSRKYFIKILSHCDRFKAMNEYRVASVGDCLTKGWEIYRREPGLLTLATLLLVILNGIASWVPFATFLTYSPLFAGLYLLIIRVKGGETPPLGDLFNGYQQLIPLVVASILTSVITAIGFLLLVIPGLYFSIAYSLTILIIADRKLDFWPAMELSRRSVNAHFMAYLPLALVIVGILILSAIPFGLGLLVAIPFCLGAQYHFYESISATLDSEAAQLPS